MIAFPMQVLTVSKALAGFPLDPTLAVAVFRVLDVLARVEQCLFIEAIIDVPGVRDIASSDDPHEAIVLPNPHLSSVRGSGSSDRFLTSTLSAYALLSLKFSRPESKMR